MGSAFVRVAFFVDQNPLSLGGVQTSVLLQKKYLERAGVDVTIFAPKANTTVSDPSVVVLPSYYLTPDREYSTIGNLGKAADRCRTYFEQTPFDVVHIQGDFSAATLGQYFARECDLPVIYTAHTNLEVMGNKVIGRSFKTVVINFFAQQHSNFLGIQRAPLVKDAWDYMAYIHQGLPYVVTPSSHFTEELKTRGVAANPLSILTGVDDDVIDGYETTIPASPPPVKFIWSGRMLPEKRILQALTAFSRATVECELQVFGSGPLKPVARRQAQALGISKRVTFHGKVTHEEMVRAFSGAHTLLQTSIGFETQGLTVFEALAVGTPSVVSDRKIASELPHGTYWLEDTGTLRGLTRTINRAAADIVAGHSHRPGPGETDFLRQSVSTKAMLDLYAKAIAEHSAG
jgi:glycosyltransferase involved in cell wall biosynthesis